MSLFKASNKAISSSGWTLGVGALDRLLAFVVYLVLARYLDIESFGAVAFALLFIEFMVLIVNSGIKELIVSKDKISGVFINTCFYSVMLVSLLIVFLFFVSVDLFFSDKSASILLSLKALCFIPFFSSFNIIQIGLLQRNFNFKSLSLRNLFSTFISGLVSIWMAFEGYGIWSLIVNRYIKVVLDTFIMFYVVKYVPTLSFSYKSFKSIYAFGIPLLLSEVLNFWSSRVMELFVSFFFGPSYFAILDVGRKFSKMVNQVSLTPLRSVCLTYVTKSNDRNKSYAAFSGGVSFFVAPALIFIGYNADFLVPFLLGEKWSDAILVAQIVSFSSIPQCLAWYFAVPLIVANKTKPIFYINIFVFAVSLVIGFSTISLGFELFVIAQTLWIGLSSFFKIFYVYKLGYLNLKLINTYYVPVLFFSVLSLMIYASFREVFDLSFFDSKNGLFDILLILISYAIFLVISCVFVAVMYKRNIMKIK